MRLVKSAAPYVWLSSPAILTYVISRATAWAFPGMPTSGPWGFLCGAVNILAAFSPIWLLVAAYAYTRRPLYRYANQRVAGMLEPEHWARVVEKIKSSRGYDFRFEWINRSICVRACGLGLWLAPWPIGFMSSISLAGEETDMSHANRRLLRKRVLESFGPYVPPQEPPEPPRPTVQEVIARAEAERGDC